MDASLPSFLLRVAGALLVLAAGAIHLWLYFDYFSTVHVVGTLFLINAAASFVIGSTLMLTPAGWALGAGIGYAAGTLGGFFLSVYHGIFGYVERLRGPWQEAAGGVELPAIVVLLVLAVVKARQTRAAVANRPGVGPVRKTEPGRLERGGSTT
jgi:hypothetical protein